MNKQYTMVHSGISKYLFTWVTVAYDCRVTVIHNSSNQEFWIAKTMGVSKHLEIREGDKFVVKGGTRIKLYDPGCGSLVVKIERIKEDGSCIETVVDEDGSFLAGSNVNRVCSTSKKHTLWRTTPVAVKIRIMMAEGWELYTGNTLNTITPGQVMWAPGNMPIGFKAMGRNNQCFMYDILAFEDILKRREPFAPDDAWSSNLNYNETLCVSHSVKWGFQFYGEEPFLLEDGAKIDIDCNRRYRLIKSEPDLPMTEFSALLKYRNIEVVDGSWGEKNLGIYDT